MHLQVKFVPGPNQKFDVFSTSLGSRTWQREKSWKQMDVFTRMSTAICSLKVMNYNLYWVVATQTFLEFSPEFVGETASNLTCAYFSNGLVQPPTFEKVLLAFLFGLGKRLWL